MPTFPPNPTNGMIVEIEAGLFYQFSTKTNGWCRVEGSGLPSVATPIKNGLMPATDLYKINRLIVPPPISSIKGDCEVPFTSGVIDLFTGDDFIKVSGDVTIRNTVNGEDCGDDFEFRIHQNTIGFNFELELDKLFDELKDRGQIKIRAPKGPTGPAGPAGQDGEDGLEVGPQGPQGADGTVDNTLTILNEFLPVDTSSIKDSNRAITDLEIVEDAEGPTLNVTRQIIGGGDDAAPDAVIPGEDESSWVLALNCQQSLAGLASDIFYVDVQPIMDSIQNKFESEIDRIKAGFEECYEFWLNTMSTLFDEQRAAICCALEFCKSREKSRDARRYLESQRINARAGGIGLTINQRGDSNSKEAFQSPLCENQSPFSTVDNPELVLLQDETSIILDGTRHVGVESQAYKFNLPAGVWVVRIDDCCIRTNGYYNGAVRIKYIRNGKEKTTQFVNKGQYTNSQEAKTNYLGLPLEITHDGGEISAFLPGVITDDRSGLIRLTFRPKARDIEADTYIPMSMKLSAPEVEPEPLPPHPDIKPPEYHLELDDNARYICEMTSENVDKYVRAWETGECCGVVVEILNQKYAIILRSIGDDMACGGNEKYDASHIAPIIKHIGHPAFAFPTFNNETLITTGSQKFKYDQHLSNTVSEFISEGKYSMPQGNPNTPRHLEFRLSTIMFPIL